MGPQSAGAVPGPACYDNGGEEPTVTDANLVLNRLGPETRLGEFLNLRRGRAEAAVAKLDRKLGSTDLNFVAEGMVRIAESNMSAAVREISVERGEDSRAFTLIAFGGAGSMHGCAVAQEVGIRRVISPNHPGNLSALGLLTSDLRHEFTRTHLSLLEEADLSVVADHLHQLDKEAHALLSAEMVSEADRDIRYSIGLRYEGQAHELDIAVNPRDLDRLALGETFSDSYFDAWSYLPTGRPAQIVTLRLVAVGRAPKFSFPRLDNSVRKLAEAEIGRRVVFFDSTAKQTSIYARTSLPAEARFHGPAIIEETGSTTVIPPNWEMRVDDVGNLIMELR